jgi:hypothetical protein
VSDFSVDELKRLSAAATPVAKWNASVWCNYDDGGWAACGPHHQSDDGNDEPETDSDLAARRDRDLIAYLGTHREHIIALLRAADALAEQVESYDRERGDFGGVWHALGEYRAAKSGACTNCGGRGYVVQAGSVTGFDRYEDTVPCPNCKGGA